MPFRSGELFKQFFLTRRKFCGDLHVHSYEQIPSLVSLQTGHPLSREGQDVTGLGAGGYFKIVGLLHPENGNGDRTTQGGLHKGYGNFANQVDALSFEKSVLFAVNHHKQVARRTPEFTRLAFTLEPELGACIHSGRNLEGDLAVDSGFSPALAILAGISHDSALSLAGRAGGSDLKKSLRSIDLASALASAADFCLASRGHP